MIRTPSERGEATREVGGSGTDPTSGGYGPRDTIQFSILRDQEPVDITRQVQAVVEHSGIGDGLFQVFAQGM